MLASDITTRVSKDLRDPSNRRWPLDTLYGYVTAAECQVCILIPEAYVVTENYLMVSGTRQTLPANAHRLIEVTRNMGAAGNTPGKAITYAERSIMDQFNPNWHADTPTSIVDEYFYDGLDPNVWYNYPPSNGSVYVETRVAKIPATITVGSQSLSIKDIYLTAVYEYSMYRALSRDSDDADPIRAQMHLTNFYNALGIKQKSDFRTAPRTNAPPAEDKQE